MNIPEENHKKMFRSRIIVLLCVLLALVLGALVVVTVLGNRKASDTDVAPDNHIAPNSLFAMPVSAARVPEVRTFRAPEGIKTATLALYQGQPRDNLPFSVSNMLPGDSYTQRFSVEVSHEAPVELYFTALVTQQTKQLGQVLNIRVTHLESDQVIYNGNFDSLDITGYAVSLPQAESKRTVASYEIQVSLPTSAGNEYQQAMLLCDLQWYVSDQGSLVPPQTGDGSSVALWTVLAAASFGGLWLLMSRRKKEAAYE